MKLKLKIVFALMLITQIGFSQKLLTKGLAKLAQAVGNTNVATTADLTNVVPTVGIGSNLHPTELGTISQSFFKNWVAGGELNFIMFTKKDVVGFVKIDGTVNLDGVPMEYLTSGMYSMVTAANPSPRLLEIVTTSGQKASFTIAPYKHPIKLVSVNGQKDNIMLDLTQDAVLELEGPEVAEGKLIKVNLAINQVGIKSIYQVCYVRSGNKITVPAAAFRNLNMKPGGDAIYSYKKSFMSVGIESMEKATDVSGAFPSVEYTAAYDDGLMVTVTKEPNLNLGLKAKGEAENMKYDFLKPNAFMSRPSGQLKKVGLLSLSIRGTTYKEYTETSTSTSTMVIGDRKETTTTTTTKTTKLEFPQQPNEIWDKLLESMYPEFMNVIQAEFGASLVPLDAITKSEAYNSVVGYVSNDKNTKVEFARSFRDTKVLSAFMPISEGYGINGANAKIMNETGADALVTLTLDLEVSEAKGSDELLMMPKMAFEIVGKTNGNITNTKYCSGTIVSKTGVAFKSDISPADLESIIRKSDMLKVFAQGLKELRTLETNNGDYTIVWDLQK